MYVEEHILFFKSITCGTKENPDICLVIILITEWFQSGLNVDLEVTSTEFFSLTTWGIFLGSNLQWVDICAWVNLHFFLHFSPSFSVSEYFEVQQIFYAHTWWSWRVFTQNDVRTHNHALPPEQHLNTTEAALQTAGTWRTPIDAGTHAKGEFRKRCTNYQQQGKWLWWKSVIRTRTSV